MIHIESEDVEKIARQVAEDESEEWFGVEAEAVSREDAIAIATVCYLKGVQAGLHVKA